jgi:ATP-dependent Clp protease ATP-binding subunit ClpA
MEEIRKFTQDLKRQKKNNTLLTGGFYHWG